jgi:hypothetical protein
MLNVGFVALRNMEPGPGFRGFQRFQNPHLTWMKAMGSFALMIGNFRQAGLRVVAVHGNAAGTCRS